LRLQTPTLVDFDDIKAGERARPTWWAMTLGDDCLT
jgi:hypothetical protein